MNPGTWIFCAAAAISAAAVTDPFVEHLSNAGFFGPGNFTDRSNADVIPALFAGLLLCAFALFTEVRRAVARSMPAARSLKLLPAVFALQIGALFGMETLEQICIAGHPLGGLLWLGGPAAFALLVHGLSCVLLTCGMMQAAAHSAKRVVQIIRMALEFLRRILTAPAPLHFSRAAAVSRLLQPLLQVLSGRAPPVLSVVRP